jgi:hypothetical protein
MRHLRALLVVWVGQEGDRAWGGTVERKAGSAAAKPASPGAPATKNAVTRDVLAK